MKAVIRLPRNEKGEPLDPVSGKPIFDFRTGDRLIKKVALYGPYSVVTLEPED